MSRTRAVAAFSLVPVLLLAGCTDDDPEPKLDPTPSSMPSSSSSAPTGVISPEDTVRAWVDARNAALSSGDTAPVEALSTSGCTTCQDSLDPIRQVHAAGGSFDTDGWRIVSTRLKSQSGDKARVTAAIKYAPGTTTPSKGASPVSYGLERHIVVVDLAKAQGRWQIKFFGYLS